MFIPSLIVSGERLGPATSVDYKADVGTYVRDNDVYASLAGYLVKTPMEDGEVRKYTHKCTCIHTHAHTCIYTHVHLH